MTVSITSSALDMLMSVSLIVLYTFLILLVYELNHRMDLAPAYHILQTTPFNSLVRLVETLQLCASTEMNPLFQL